MLRYPRLVAAALFCAALSGGSLASGLVGALPVIKAILNGKQTDSHPLHEQALTYNAAPSHHYHIPQFVLDVLPTTAWSSIVFIVCILGVITVIGSLANFFHQYLSLTLVNATITAIRREAFHRVIRLPIGLVVRDQAGHASGGSNDVISRIINDTSTVHQGMTALISKALSQVVKGIASLIAAFVINWQLTLCTLAIAPILAVTIRTLGKRIRRYSKKALISQSELQLVATETLQGLRVVKVHSAERFEAGRFHKINRKVMHELNKVRTARALSSPLMETLNLFVVGVLVLIATKAIFDGHLAADDFFAVIIALGAAGASFKPVTGLVNDVQQSAAGAERIRELLAAPPEPGHDARLPKLPAHTTSIEFRNVCFTYPGASNLSLRNVSCTIMHGERIAVVGPNGCGKTTLLSLIPRLFDPSSGVILLDGHNIAEFNLRSLRRQIGVVPQETVLFKRSIRDNICYGAHTGFSDEEVVDAATRARAHDFISKLPAGYRTEISEQGSNLSGGQRQRIAIARAILRDPAILILDEATSMVDADSEAHINAAINEFSAGRTTLIVAHRLSTVLSANRILVMDQGALIASGTHHELLKSCEVYQQLARHQLLGDPNA